MYNISAYRRKDGRWEVRIYTHEKGENKRKYRSFYGKTKESAELKAKMFTEPPEEYTVTETTVMELAEEYITVKAPLLKASTVSNYKMKLETHIIPALGRIECCSLKPQNVYDLMNKMREKRLSERYISDVVVLLKSMIRYSQVDYHIYKRECYIEVIAL